MRSVITRTHRARGAGLLLAAALATTAGATACKKDERLAARTSKPEQVTLPAELARPRPAGDPAQIASPALLAHVPADTPYVIGSLVPTPVAFWGKIKDALGGKLEPLVAAALAGAGDDGPLALLAAVRAELDGKWDAAGLATLGLSASPNMVMYGLGLMPMVMRLEIADEAALLAAIERVAQRAQLTLPAPLQLDGRRYWRLDVDGEFTIIIGFAGKQLVTAFGPPGAVDPQLPLILGAQLPPSSLATTKGLQAAYAAHGFGPHVIGYVDIHRVVELGLAMAGSAPSAACKAESAALAARAPRIVMGYDMGSASRMTGGAVVELAPDLRDRVAGMRRSVPGMLATLAGQPLMGMGVGVDLVRGQQLLRDAAERIGKLGVACDEPSLSEGADAMASGLQAQLPPMIAGIAGGSFALYELALGDTSPMPTKVDALALLVADQPKLLVDELAKVLPVTIPADGKLHPVVVPGLPVPGEIVAGVGPRAISVAMGTKARGVATTALTAQGDGTVPLLAMAYDYGRLLQVQAQIGRMVSAGDPAAEAEAAVNEAFAKLYGRASAVVDVTDKGVVMWGAFELK